ncbi:DUF4157 domain-containing protein [Mucilaginibacter sp. BJC16-A38]|uniref:eCIS core domain-containing protein n=1 Tax=Mucilaginibacter phenanthrenivorans TaxID=1234842 RepID=UPI002157A70A|nr:DUF4157 domain-containing protein [Mucilaginibacter phenanthrenivorans]MCR8557638.1 DUF4157 domain-containing protein [Mucilaginibacter phenanthrenivorans]
MSITPAGKQNSNPQPLNKIAGKPCTFFQPKLTINQPNDVYEQEADAMADKVMRMAAPSTNASAFFKPANNTLQRKCRACEDEEEHVHRKESDVNEVTGGHGLDNYVSSLSSSGQQMSAESKSFFEPRFGHDFSNVRIHTDTVAAKSAQSINALAYTTGNNIVFNAGQYSPDSDGGKRLMAHELTHVVQQQGPGANLQRFIQRQSITMDSGRLVGDTGNLKEDVVEVIESLHRSNSLSHADYSAELLAIAAIPPMTFVPAASIPKTIAAIATNEQAVLSKQVAQNIYGLTLGDNVGKGMPNAKADITALQDFLHTHLLIANSDFNAESAAVKAGSDPVSEPSIIKTLEALSKMKVSKLAEGTVQHDVMSNTHALTKDERSKAEAALIPGATSSGGKTTVPSPDAICTTPGLEKEIRKPVEKYVHDTATTFTATKAKPPVLPIPQMNSMADVVQDELQTYFKSYLMGATHDASSKFTPGAFDVKGKLKDQSVTTQWQNESGRTGWVNYWISTQAGGNAHHCKQGDMDKVAKSIATDPALIPDIDTTVQSWPAEATNGININPYIRDADADAAEKRKGRWDAFTTILHESIHLLAHPNFIATFTQMKDDTMQILKEGFNDMFRRELWSGPGNLFNRIATSAYDPKRKIIEGAALPYDASVVFYHTDYEDERDKAIKIRDAVGVDNVKAAYFLGHTELLGLGAGSHGVSDKGNLSGKGQYKTTDPDEESTVSTVAGETYAALSTRLNAPSGSISDAATGNSIAPGAAALPPKVKVTGIRHVTVITDDTLSSVADQNGVTSFDIIRANNLGKTDVTVGQHLIIPVHASAAAGSGASAAVPEKFITPDSKSVGGVKDSKISLSVHIDFLTDHTRLHVFVTKSKGGDISALDPLQVIGEPGKGGDYQVTLSPVPPGSFIRFKAISDKTGNSVLNITGKYTVNN